MCRLQVDSVKLVRQLSLLEWDSLSFFGELVLESLAMTDVNADNLRVP